MKECCANCRFFKEPSQLAYDGNGTCLRYPPAAGRTWCGFPAVYPSTWCGEYREALANDRAKA